MGLSIFLDLGSIDELEAGAPAKDSHKRESRCDLQGYHGDHQHRSPGRYFSGLARSSKVGPGSDLIYMSQTTASLTTIHMFGVRLTGVFALMVFCKECQQKVEECPHFVAPIKAKRVEVFDEEVKSLAYDAEQRILEVAFKVVRSGSCFRCRPVFTRNCGPLRSDHS